MGLFGFKTKYDITPNVEELKGAVTNYNAVDVIKMNAKVTVPEGYWFLIGKKGKALDSFSEGEYFFNYANLPYTCRRYSIDKVKKGKSQDKFPANFYFISKALCPGYFKTYRKAEMGAKAYGFFSTKVHGVFSYTVTNVKEYMQSLLNEYDYIKTGEAEDIVDSWVGDTVLKELEHKKFILADIIANSDIVMDSLKTAVRNMLATAGIELKDFKVTKYDLPKEYQAESDKNLAIQNNPELAKTAEGQQDDLICDNNDSPLFNDVVEDVAGNSVVTNQQMEQGLNSKDIIKNEEVANNITEEYVPFGDFIITTAKQEQKTQNQQMEVTTFNVDEKEKQETEEKVPQTKTKQKTFVDLSLNELYNNKQEVKRCLNCGAENSLNAKKCILCGETFLED